MPKSPQNASKTQTLVICISGMAGTGKSTLAKKLAEKYGLRYYSGGDALKELAKEKGYGITDEGWWESSVGLNFLQERRTDPKFDRAVDDRFLEYAKQGNVLLDSWTMPWLLKDGFKIWLEASFEKRASRVAQRDSISEAEAKDLLKEKEGRTKTIYKELYGFSLGEDLSPFDFILDTDNLTAGEVFEVLCQIMDKVVLKT